MKCVKCGIDNTFPERTAGGGKCKNCKHPFTFDPRSSPVSIPGTSIQVTDQYFFNLLNSVSAQGKLYFTERQFFYFLNQRLFLKNMSNVGCWAGFLFVLVVGLSWLALASILNFPTGFIVFGVIATIVTAIFFGAAVTKLPWVRKSFMTHYKRGAPLANIPLARELLERWSKNNGFVQRLLPPPPNPSQPAVVSREIAAYSFDRLVVTDRPTIAHFLIANNFHFENNCAVLSIDRYPYNLFDTVMAMLRRNPDLKVYALHDASPVGVHTVHRLRTSLEWFQSTPNVVILDLGLTPGQVMEKPFFVQNSTESAKAALGLAAPVRAALKPEEIRWLEEGNFVELESVAPEALLRIVTRAISQSRALQTVDDGGGLMILDTSPGYYGGDATVYTFDTFG